MTDPEADPEVERRRAAHRRAAHRRARGALVVALAAVAAQVAVLYVPQAPDPSGGALPPWIDKAVHVAVFALATFTTLRAASLAGLGSLGLGLVAAANAAHAPLSELVQHALLPNRSGSLADAAADLAGVALAALAWWIASALGLSAPRTASTAPSGRPRASPRTPGTGAPAGTPAPRRHPGRRRPEERFPNGGRAGSDRGR